MAELPCMLFALDRQESLEKLVVALVENDRVDLLCTLPLRGNQPEFVDRVLHTKAKESVRAA